MVNIPWAVHELQVTTTTELHAQISVLVPFFNFRFEYQISSAILGGSPSQALGRGPTQAGSLIPMNCSERLATVDRTSISHKIHKTWSGMQPLSASSELPLSEMWKIYENYAPQKAPRFGWKFQKNWKHHRGLEVYLPHNAPGRFSSCWPAENLPKWKGLSYNGPTELTLLGCTMDYHELKPAWWSYPLR